MVEVLRDMLAEVLRPPKDEEMALHPEVEDIVVGEEAGMSC
jgi:hypothetical protein